MTTKRKRPEQIIPAYCIKCRDYLLGCPVNTKVYCPVCQIWSIAVKPTGRALLIDYKKPETITYERWYKR